MCLCRGTLLVKKNIRTTKVNIVETYSCTIFYSYNLYLFYIIEQMLLSYDYVYTDAALYKYK